MLYVLVLFEKLTSIWSKSVLHVHRPAVNWQSYAMQIKNKRGKLKNKHPHEEACWKKPYLKLVTVKHRRKSVQLLAVVSKQHGGKINVAEKLVALGEQFEDILLS